MWKKFHAVWTPKANWHEIGYALLLEGQGQSLPKLRNYYDFMRKFGELHRPTNCTSYIFIVSAVQVRQNRKHSVVFI